MKHQPRIVTASQLDTYIHYLTAIHRAQASLPAQRYGRVLSSDIQTKMNRPAQHYTLIWLEEHGFITVQRGKENTQLDRVNTYRLARPLSEIRLVDLLAHLDMYENSPSVKLMKFNPALTLDDLKNITCPEDQFEYPGTFYSFDFIVLLLSTLNTDTQISYQQILVGLGEYSRSYTYVVGALSTLAKQILVDRQQQRTGYRLYRPFETLAINDVIPAVSHRTEVFNKIMYLTRSLPLSLFV